MHSPYPKPRAVGISTDPNATTTDQLLNSFVSGSIAARSSVTIRTLLMFTPPVSPGTYWVGIIVDDLDEVLELDEGSNIVSRQVIISL